MGLPTFCRVRSYFETYLRLRHPNRVWMPQKNWNGRIEGTGNGGLAGTIIYKSLAAGLLLGYAVANTDMGMATPPGANASIFVGRPERWLTGDIGLPMK